MSETKSPSNLFKLRRGQLSKNEITIRQMCSGACAGLVTKTITAPLERIKILLQIQGMKNTEVKYKGLVDAGYTVFKEDGVMALWKGNGANCVRVVPVYALKFSFNDRFRNIVKKPGQSDKDLSTVQLMLCGTSAGLFQQMCTFPLELVRTRLSLQRDADPNKYRGIFDVFKRTINEEGVASLYKGLGPTIISGAPYVGLQMTFYELWKRVLPKNEDGSIGTVSKLAAGAFGGLTAQIITYPGDTVRRRMIVNGMGNTERVYRNSIDCTIKIIKFEGATGLFKGLTANAVRCIPAAGIQFAAYDFFKEVFLPNENQ